MFVQKIDNFFTEEMFTNIQGVCDDLLRREGNTFLVNLEYWPNYIVKDSFPVLIHKINRQSQLYLEIKEAIENKTELIVGSEIMFYYWTRHSYIPWHNDGSHPYALSIYLNEHWDKDFGGIFLYKESEEDIRGIMPKRNLAVLQKGGMMHCTTPVNHDGYIRKSIQVFLTKKNQGADDDN